MFRRRKERKRVALFGGSFNPPHIGHTAICKWLFSKGLVDEVWIIPCYIHPFGKKLEVFEHRLKMCRLALGNLRLPIRFLEVERELGEISHTLRTIEHLKKIHPDHRFYLVTGSDVRSETKTWYGFDKIREHVDIIEVKRGESSPIPDVSSTEIRRRIKDGQRYLDLVESEVAMYIATKGLFRDDELTED